MTETFKERVKNYPHPLYYNTTGSTTAYKLAIPHLSYALQEKKAFMGGAFLYPKQPLHIVDLLEENIEIIAEMEKVELVKLKFLK